jgi:hypothetical protein
VREAQPDAVLRIGRWLPVHCPGRCFRQGHLFALL